MTTATIGDRWQINFVEDRYKLRHFASESRSEAKNGHEAQHL